MSLHVGFGRTQDMHNAREIRNRTAGMSLQLVPGFRQGCFQGKNGEVIFEGPAPVNTLDNPNKEFSDPFLRHEGLPLSIPKQGLEN